MAWLVILLVSSVALIGNSAGTKKNEDALLKELDQLLNAAHQTEKREPKREPKIQKKNVLCGASTSEQSGDIKSPGYPVNYGNHEDCVYTIIIPGTANIHIEFMVLDIEDATNCGYDAVILPKPLGTELRICGQSPQNHIHDIQGVTGQYSIRFVSDFSRVGKGFLLHYTVNGGGVPNPNPSPSCPSFSCPNFCESGFSQPCNQCTCAAHEPAYAYQKCGTQTACSCGFRVNMNGCPVCMCTANVSPTSLDTSHKTCNMVLDEVSSTFASPNWPNTYPNAICTITLRIPLSSTGSTLRLNFQYIQLQDSANCLYESISFGHVKICGSGPRSYVIPGVSGDFVITFSGSLNYGDGFYADYQITGSGVYPTPNPYPNPYPYPGVDKTHVLGKLNELYAHAQEAVARAQEVSTAIQQLISEVQNPYGYNGNPYGNNGNPYGNNGNPYGNNGNPYGNNGNPYGNNGNPYGTNGNYYG